MFRMYYFSDDVPALKVRHYVGLSVAVVILAWKLLRGISPNPATWHVHVYALLLLALGSLLVLGKNRLQLRTFDMSLAVFIFCVTAMVRIVAFGTYRDAFTVATLAFFGYFFLSTSFTRITDREFFRGVSLVLTGLVFIEILGIVEHTFEWGIIDYAGMGKMAGVAPIEGVYAGQSFILFFLDFEVLQRFFGRLSGVAGTPYATAGLMSAIAVFGLASRRWFLALLGVTALLLSSTGSAILALYASVAVLYRKNPATWVFLLLLIPFMLWVFELKGITLGTLRTHYLPISIEGSGFSILVAALIGEGRHTSSIQAELRIIGLVFSLGLISILCLLEMLRGWIRVLRLPGDPEIRRDYAAVGYFTFTLVLATVHYPALFIYPNIMIVVGFLALISSRLRISRAASLRSEALIVV